MISKFDEYLDNLSKWGVILCITLMLSLSIINIILRQMGIVFIWIEPLVRHLVFLATFFGGALATGSSEHIKIDIVSRLLEKTKHTSLKIWIQRLVLFVTLVAVSILLSSSIDLMHLEFEDERLAFFDIPTGYLLGIIPFGMSLISLRVFVKFILTFQKRIQ